jgi:hypothetical protein
MKICECLWNCGLEVSSGKRFIIGHYNRGKPILNQDRPSNRKGKMSVSNKGRKLTEEQQGWQAFRIASKNLNKFIEPARALDE